jgi:hypothetical protein
VTYGGIIQVLEITVFRDANAVWSGRRYNASEEPAAFHSYPEDGCSTLIASCAEALQMRAVCVQNRKHVHTRTPLPILSFAAVREAFSNGYSDKGPITVAARTKA